jgi:HD-GYP domain-containing protein (c-di-GMP phosphodiesterase class II)
MPLSPSKDELIAVSPDNLHVGISLRFSLRDERGNVLLGKGLRIDTQQMLDSLPKRRAVYVSYVEAAEATRVLMSGLNEAMRRDAALKDIDSLVSFSETEKQEEVKGTLVEAWTEAEARLRTLLANLAQGGTAAVESARRIDGAIDLFHNQLFNQDREAAVFLLIHRAITAYSGYSALHSLLTATMVHLLAPTLKLTATERVSLTRAALTMNVGMTALQDALATQKQRPSALQQAQIEKHAAEGVRLLHAAGVTDSLWLNVVFKHHDDLPPGLPLAARPTADKLARILQVVDRYTAAMSPRASRAGRESKDAARSAIVQPGATGHDEVGLALMMMLGLHPAGTFVKLANGETAVVLRKGAKPNEPYVASVLNRHDEPIAEPRLRHTAKPEVAVVHGVSASGVRVRLNTDLMLRQLAFTRTGADRETGRL